MLVLILAIPALAALAMILFVSTESALLQVYIPTLIFLPDFYYSKLPPLSFHGWAILPIGAVLCLYVLRGKWRASWLDAAVIALALWDGISDFHATGGFVNPLFYALTVELFPYMAGKLLIEQTGQRVAISRRLIVWVVIVSVLSIYEFRMGSNLFLAFWGKLFGAVPRVFTQMRGGFGRAQGPFEHAIAMGTVVIVAILLQRYLMRFGHWEPKFRWLPWSKPRILLIGLVAGSIMTLSRGPWVGLAAGLAVAVIGTSRDRNRALRRAVVLLLVGGVLLYFGGKAYIGDAKSYGEGMRSSAAYRAIMVQVYQNIAQQKAFWGWGTAEFPTVPGMRSVDNWYLCLELEHGITGLVLFVLMLTVAFVRLFRRGMRAGDADPETRAFIFTLMGIILAIAVTIGTVYLAPVLDRLLLFVLGWADACLLYRRDTPPATAALSAARVPEEQFAFREVLA